MSRLTETMNDSPIKTAILIYIIIMSIIVVSKSSLIFTEDGKLKMFGTGNAKNTTIFPLWFIAIIAGIFSYYIVTIFIMISN
tara:strand:- start:246 stop:491 length:246 start_codon:yes stop_codon:yes gene_type:complete